MKTYPHHGAVAVYPPHFKGEDYPVMHHCEQPEAISEVGACWSCPVCETEWQIKENPRLSRLEWIPTVLGKTLTVAEED